MLLFILKPGISKGNEAVKKEMQKILKEHPAKVWEVQETNKNEEKTITIEQSQNTINGANDALDFAVKNVDKYYPDMKEHLDSLIDKFRDQEQKDTVNFLFQEHIFKNINDPKKKVASIIYCIESFVFKGNKQIKKKFWTTYKIGTIIDKEEYKYLFDFDKGYNKRFKWYYMKLEKILIDMNKKIDENMKKIDENMKKIDENMKKIEKLDKEIAEQKKQIEGIINTFTVNDVKNNVNIKKLVLETEKFYIEVKNEIYPHLAELIKVAKQ